MAKYNNQKAKILFLQQMLYETGENHTISMQMILDNLQKKGIRAERKSIYDDMDVLRFFGMDIRYRRERPSGYYLEGLSETALKMPEPVYVPSPQAEELPAGEDDAAGPERDPGTDDQTAVLPDDSSWMKPARTDRKKQMKLQCSEKGRKLAWEYFGDSAEYKKREDETFVVTAPLLEDPSFFGWLTAAGGEIRLIKPKKTSQAYRDFLKGIIKDYK